MARCWRSFALILALIPLAAACGTPLAPFGPRQAPAPSRLAEAERQRQALARARLEQQWLEDRCRRERPALEAAMAALRQAEGRLARVKGETYVPSTPPPPWDEAAESRFRLEDREADWQRHRQEQERWERREASQRARWLADHQARLREAQGQLDRQAQSLRARRADLFTGPTSIEFNPAVAAAIRHCRGLATGPVGETAPPLPVPKGSRSVTLPSQFETPP
jgi:hypothetical protein